MANELRSQGTELWMVDNVTVPATPALVKIGNITNLGDFGAEASDIDTTNLDSLARESINGLADNGTFDFTVNLDPKSVAHKLMVGQTLTANNFTFYIGLSDGTAPPTLAGSTLTVPAARSGATFTGSVKRFKPNAGGIDGLVTVPASIKVSGTVAYTWKP